MAKNSSNKGGKAMSGKMKIIMAMLIYGSIGVLVRNIKLSAIEIAFLRASIGSLFLLMVSLTLRSHQTSKINRNYIYIYFLSGVLLGVNWFFLFKAFEYTSISNAILLYYLAPIIVILLSPLLLKEQLTMYKIICMLTAIAGLSLIVSSNFSMVLSKGHHLAGIGYALLAAVFYASVILINKKYPSQNRLVTTKIQLFASAFVLLPILFMNKGNLEINIEGQSLWLILILGIVHTGVAYLLYFASMKTLKAQTVAIYSYIDPISAVLFAWLFLGEHITLIQGLGGVLILGATYFVDFDEQRLVNSSCCKRVVNG